METMVWPADARPWLSGVDGWVSMPNQAGDVGLWHPGDERAAQGGQARPPYAPVFVAARVLHPYELPPGVLTDHLGDAKELSSKPATLEDWIGMERIVQFQGPAGIYPGRARQVATQARLLDLHLGVRRLLIRCQAPQEEFEKRAADFQRVIAGMQVPREPVEPIVVPLDPASYKAKRPTDAGRAEAP